MATYQELRAQLEALAVQVEAARMSEKKEIINEVRNTVKAYGLTEREVFGGPRPASKGSGEAKYRDPETGATWCGRGRCPKWIAGKERDDFLVKD
jgi:DNA-binding protein H-NS